MRTRSDDTALELDIPSQEDDPVERRRRLNILTQRRYRRRKKARLEELEERAQLEDPPHIVSHTSDVAQQYSSKEFSLGDSEILSGTISEEWLYDVNLDESLHIPNSNEVLQQTPAISNELSGMIDANPHPVIIDRHLRNEFGLETPSSIIPSVSVSQLDFADYAISVPGLSVLHAHFNIHKHMHGPNSNIDVFNPCTISPFYSMSDHVSTAHIPAHYRPSILQKRIEHHPVVDCLPWESFRDRFLYVMSLPRDFRPRIAQQDMPSVTLELIFAIKDAAGGLRVWNHDPFLPENWEIGQTFYAKFWWAIDGDVVQQSNRIRARRGEVPLRFTVADAQ